MFSKKENIFLEYVMYCGFYYEKTEGPFRKYDTQKGY